LYSDGKIIKNRKVRRKEEGKRATEGRKWKRKMEWAESQLQKEENKFNPGLQAPSLSPFLPRPSGRRAKNDKS